ncbi:peptidoglycan DD-metalloendopeptidase family protein [Massilia agilis]|uniref:Peptidoglycan DD-metalloendopeptidase family protein n=1 Tax=Massilia agilis TaxID=1811226 RepID=A0ABT2DA47_9BURK|nr:M23 family metallopeptidase [Massilia agilis]MCS0808182.1 peptidoglycan DD-metalloendopeptidase family protein [Massilia agilis]
MRWLLTFLFGVLVGAGALFAWLSQLPPAQAPQPVVTATGHALPPPPPQGEQVRLADPPKIEPDLTEADLPLRPDPVTATVLATVPRLASGGGKLLVPVEGVKASDISDTFDQQRGSARKHEALDIMAPLGTRVLAAGDGKVVKLFKSKPGGLTVYQFDPEEKYAYYYAHLDRYAEGLKEGMTLKRGDLVGYVGSTGNADAKAPHLHFALIELTPEKQWWKGTPVDPYPLLER